MPQAVDSELSLYVDDTCLVFQHRNIKTIEEHLNRDFSFLVDWFVDDKLSLHFGEGKTKSILFSPKHRSLTNCRRPLLLVWIISFQKSSLFLNECLTGESMAMQVCAKVTSKLKFLYRKNRFLSKDLRRLLCNALIQPHFDYACAAWYPNLNKKYKNKLQVLQNKCIRFCLQLGSREHIGTEHFDTTNWLQATSLYKRF